MASSPVDWRGLNASSDCPRHFKADRVLVDIMEDQSGVDLDKTGWNDPENLPGTLIEVLREVGRTYVPTMIANAGGCPGGRAKLVMQG